MASGGVSSPFSHIEANEFTEAELRAAVEAAGDWGTYVTAHAYTPNAVQRAIRAGVKVIDHGQLADEETVRMMADNGIWWSLQPLTYDARRLRAHVAGIAEEGTGGVRRNRERLPAGEAIQRQDGVGF